MRDRELRRRCRRLLRELDIRPPLDVTELCRRVGEKRGKPIVTAAREIPVPGPFGAWIATPTTDYIVYQAETTPSHQDHIVLHELGHILAGHPREEVSELGPEAAFRRTDYDSEHEREAETVATIIMEWASVLDRVSPHGAAGTPARRIETALDDRLGWL